MANQAPEEMKNGTRAPQPAPNSNALSVTAPTADEARAVNAFSSNDNFQAALRMAKMLADSSLVPESFRGNIPNCTIAIELAARIGASVFAVMQNLAIVHGKPSFQATFLIATVNASGRFTPLRFRFVGKEGQDSWGCRAFAKDKTDGEECVGALITMGLAKAEGWHGKPGSKWKTMPEQMLMYRAASFWTRVYAPEISQGMSEREEVIDTVGVTVAETPAALTPGSSKALEAELLATPTATPTKVATRIVPHDPETGEVSPEDEPREPGSDG